LTEEGIETAAQTPGPEEETKLEGSKKKAYGANRHNIAA